MVAVAQLAGAHRRAHAVVVRVTSGKVNEVAIDPGPLDVAYQFAIRASAQTWRNFGVPVPPQRCLLPAESCGTAAVAPGAIMGRGRPAAGSFQ